MMSPNDDPQTQTAAKTLTDNDAQANATADAKAKAASNSKAKAASNSKAKASKSEFEVKSPVKRNGKTLDVGDTLKVSPDDKEFAELVAAGVIDAEE